jgi:hypothetical protein
MGLSALVICLIFVTAFFVAVFAGIGWAFVAVYLPVMILLNQLPMIQIPHAPLAPPFAPLYAILLAIPLRGDSLRFRICSVDIIFFLLLISATITAWTTEVFETGINTLRTDFFTLTAPYLLARIVFKDWQMRRAALHVLIGVLAIISVAALIEFRFQPYFYLHVLQSLGMGNKIQAMAYVRYGFFRVSGPVEHPIYFGNMCVGLLGMIAVLARTSGVRLTNGWVATALFAAVGCIITSISFTPYLGMIAGSAYFLTLIIFPFTRKLVLPLTLLGIAAIFAVTYHVANTPLGEKPASEAGGSLWTRKQIIHESWAKARDAGPFGYGIRADFTDQDDKDDNFDLKSVDNSYMQFTLTHGYVYTILWISIGVFFSLRVTLAFMKIRHPSQVFPLAVSTATVLGLMVSMYTVWAGALYTVIWVILLGLANTLIDQVRFGVPAAVPQLTPAMIPAGKYGPGFPGKRPIRVLTVR